MLSILLFQRQPPVSLSKGKYLIGTDLWCWTIIVLMESNYSYIIFNAL